MPPIAERGDASARLAAKKMEKVVSRLSFSALSRARVIPFAAKESSLTIRLFAKNAKSFQLRGQLEGAKIAPVSPFPSLFPLREYFQELCPSDWRSVSLPSHKDFWQKAFGTEWEFDLKGKEIILTLDRQKDEKRAIRIKGEDFDLFSPQGFWRKNLFLNEKLNVAPVTGALMLLSDLAVDRILEKGLVVLNMDCHGGPCFLDALALPPKHPVFQGKHENSLADLLVVNFSKFGDYLPEDPAQFPYVLILERD